MFGSDGGEGQVNLGRRLFCRALGRRWGRGVISLRRPRVIAEAAKTEPAEVTIVQFSDAGQRLAKVKVARVVKSDEEWRKQLPSGVYEITRHADTELAYSGKYWNLHDKGIFRCIVATTRCSVPRRSSIPEPAGRASGSRCEREWFARYRIRALHGANSGRVQECDAHLGHVFDDGPKPTGLRYCMNSASLRFVRQRRSGEI